MSLGAWPIVGIIAAVLFAGAGLSRAIRGPGEKSDVASYDGGRTRRNRKGGSRRFRK